MAEMLSKSDFDAIKRDIEDAGKTVNTDAVIAPRYGDQYKSFPMLSRLFEAMLDQGLLDLDDLRTAIDIALEAGVGGAGWTDLLVTTQSGVSQREVNLRFITPRIFGAKGNGVTDDSDAIRQCDNFSIANNATVLIDRDYVAKNLNLGGKYLGTGGKIISTIDGATENVIVAKSNLDMFGVKFATKVTGRDGGGNFGYAIRVGSYDQATDGSTDIKNFKLNNLVFDEIQGGYRTACIEVLGNCYEGEIKNITHNGNFYVVILHWGGDVDVTKPHSSYITYSYHPHDIVLENLMHKCEPLFSTYSRIDYSYVLSAVYDITANGLKSDKANCTLWITVGDVYNQVAVAEQKDKVMTGIVVDGVIADNPTNGGNTPIFITGEPITKRTNESRLYAVDAANPMSVKVKNARINGDSSLIETGTAVRLQSVKNIEIDVVVAGYENSSSSWLLVQHATSSNIKAKGASKIGARVMMDDTCTADIDSVATGDQAINLTPIYYTGFTLSSAAEINDTTITCAVRPDTSAFLSVMRCGAMITYQNRVIATLTESIGAAPDSSATTFTAKITPLPESIPVSASLNIYLPNGGVVKGRVKGGSSAAMISNSHKLDVKNLQVNDFVNYGIALQGTFHSSLKISEDKFSGGGVGATVDRPANILIFGNSTPTTNVFENCEISSNKFDLDAQPNVAHHIYSPTFRRHRGLKIFNNEGGKLANVDYPAIAVSNSTYNQKGCMQQIYSNDFKGHLVASNNTIQGSYVGDTFLGAFAGGVSPSTLETFIGRGDVFYNSNISTQYPGTGWVCIQDGYSTDAELMRLDYFGTTKSTSSSELASKTSSINTSFKYLGLDVYATDTGKFYKAKGADSVAQWVAFDGSVITPV